MNVNAGAPGPPFKNLYVQPTASSTPSACTSNSIEPTVCERSHSTIAPAARASSVKAFTSARAAVR